MALYKYIQVSKNGLHKMYWEDENSIRDIAKIYKVSAGTIKYWMKKFNIPIRTQKTACLTNKCKKKNSESIMQEKHPLWKGIITKKTGYRMIRLPGEYILEHRKKVEDYIGRKLQQFEIVHHINGIRNDNRLKNLYVFTKREHDKYTSTKNKIKLTSNLQHYADSTKEKINTGTV